MENNTAFVAKLGNITPIVGADKIVLADVILSGVKITQIVTGVETLENTPVVYFDSNMCLNPETIIKDYPELATYLGKNGRVKVVKLRGAISNGLAVDVSKFYKYFRSEIVAKQVMVEGYSFLDIEKKNICKKYTPPVVHVQGTKEKKGRKGKTHTRMIPGIFRFHVDTEQLARSVYKVNPELVISLSRKVHGTSCIASNCLVTRKLSFMDKIAKVFGVKVQETEYALIFASRTVVKDISD